MEHARWQEEHGKMMRHLRAALEAEHATAAAAATSTSTAADAQLLRQLVDAAAAHHGVLAELKAVAARADAFHLVSGAWVSAAERCFLWIGGFRPSELIKVSFTLSSKVSVSMSSRATLTYDKPIACYSILSLIGVPKSTPRNQLIRRSSAFACLNFI
jgi:hypothetical protein